MGRIAYEAKHSSPYESLIDVVTEWLKWSYPYQTFGKPSLSLLVKAVDTYDHPLAAKVFEKFTSPAGSAVGEHSLYGHHIPKVMNILAVVIGTFSLHRYQLKLEDNSVQMRKNVEESFRSVLIVSLF